MSDALTDNILPPGPIEALRIENARLREMLAERDKLLGECDDRLLSRLAIEIAPDARIVGDLYFDRSIIDTARALRDKLKELVGPATIAVRVRDEEGNESNTVDWPLPPSPGRG